MKKADLHDPRKARNQVVITHSPCEDDEIPATYEVQGFIRWVDEVLQANYKKPKETPWPTFKQCIELIELHGYKHRIDVVKPTLCYTYTCDGAEDLQQLPPKPLPNDYMDVYVDEYSSNVPGGGFFCADCRILWPLHEAACKKVGVTAWDETFVVFREGVLAERRDRLCYCGQPSNPHTPMAGCV